MLAGQCLDACGAAVAVTTVVSGRRDPQASARTWARAPAASRSSRYPPSSTPTTGAGATRARNALVHWADRKSTRLNSSHLVISYAVFCLKKKKKHSIRSPVGQSRLHVGDRQLL